MPREVPDICTQHTHACDYVCNALQSKEVSMKELLPSIMFGDNSNNYFFLWSGKIRL